MKPHVEYCLHSWNT